MKKEAVDALKYKKIFRIVLIVCAVIIAVEACLFVYMKYQQEANSVYYDAFQMVRKDGDDYVAVGSSDFKRSKKYDYTNGVEKGKLVKYDKDKQLLLEVQYDKGLASTFTSVLVVEDGYIVTGSGAYDEYQQENNLRDAFLIKYDKSGNKVWEKFYGVLSNTRFNQAILVEDGIVVIGQSIYENMEIGNHTTGGGVIVKYDFDGNEIWHNNHGGNKSGNFLGIVEVEGDFYVVGKDAKDTGNLIKFNKDGEYVWHKNYSYTDSTGFQDIVYYDDQLYVVGSKKILEDEDSEDRTTDNTDAVIVVYDLKGNVKDEVMFGGSKMERFTGIEELDGNLYLIGITNSPDSPLSVTVNEENEAFTSGFFLSYDKDLKLVDSQVLGGENNDVLTEMTVAGDDLLISGYSNSSDGVLSGLRHNGKDYYARIVLMRDLGSVWSAESIQ